MTYLPLSKNEFSLCTLLQKKESSQVTVRWQTQLSNYDWVWLLISGIKAEPQGDSLVNGIFSSSMTFFPSSQNSIKIFFLLDRRYFSFGTCVSPKIINQEQTLPIFFSDSWIELCLGSNTAATVDAPAAAPVVVVDDDVMKIVQYFLIMSILKL